jgi:hypothetical protein
VAHVNLKLDDFNDLEPSPELRRMFVPRIEPSSVVLSIQVKPSLLSLSLYLYIYIYMTVFFSKTCGSMYFIKRKVFFIMMHTADSMTPNSI